MQTLPEAAAVAKVTRRLVPFLVLCYLVAYLDRVNVGFAALQMNPALGLDASAFGFGAGIFFFTYFIFEVPSNLALEKFGARRWIARIMVTWGIVSGSTAFIPQISQATGLSPEHTFYAVRLLLGVAEAGFFPGIIFFLTLWFPSAYRARIVGYFMAAIPLSSLVGAPISGALLGVTGAGLAGWQWLFILEAAPALIMAVAVLFYLTDKPADAAWLSTEERDALAARLAAERRQREAAQPLSVGQAMLNPRVLALALVYFAAVAGNYGIGFFLPQIVKGFGMTDLQTGFVTAIPYLAGVCLMIWWGRRSDRKMGRKGHAALALGVAGAAIAAAAFTDDPYLKMAAITLASFGVFGSLPVFWTLPTAFLAGPAAAAGIAVINAVGNLSGFAGPFVMGRIKDATGSYFWALLAISATAFAGMAIVLSLRHDGALERAPQSVPAE